jgi:outer membrane protein assembly factor BamB
MLATGGYLYCLTDQGIAFCWRGSDGEEMWKQRLKGPVSSSPVLAGGHIYQANELGTHYVFKLNPEKLEIVAENQVGSESFATPSICGGQIFLRTAVREGGKRQEWLYCFGTAK